MKHVFDTRTRPLATQVESVVSGPGLANVYEFLATRYGGSASTAPILRLPKAQRPEAIAAAATKPKPDQLALSAVTLMLQAFGGELRQVALRTLPTGGLFVAGGIAPKLAPLLNILSDAYANGDPVLRPRRPAPRFLRRVRVARRTTCESSFLPERVIHERTPWVARKRRPSAPGRDVSATLSRKKEERRRRGVAAWETRAAKDRRPRETLSRMRRAREGPRARHP